MKKLLFIYGCLSLLLTLGMALSLQRPKPKRTAPDPRYSSPAIGEPIVKNTQDFTVLISDESMEGIGRGTGILLDTTTVLTCAHMLSSDHSAKSLWIYPYPGAQVVHATVKFVNYPADLSLLQLS